MDHFDYRDGALCAETVAIPEIAAEVGTPFYCYSTATLTRHYRVLESAFTGRDVLIAYSVKANSNLAVIATLARLGAGADVVSEGEGRRALAAGVAPERVVFSGVGKTRDEMAYALAHGIVHFNVESAPELEALSAVATETGVTARVALRVNPDVAAGTHDKISTGRKFDKFGVAIADAPLLYRRAAALPGLQVDGVDIHIGSQLTDLEPLRQAFERAIELVHSLRAEGHAIERLDLGGGLGIPYGAETPPGPDAYARLVFALTKDLECRIVLEPGRVIAGNAGLLISTVVYVKDTEDRRIVILDSAMNDLIRPALYGASHIVVPVREPAAGAPLAPVDLVGPICESTDTFAVDRPMPPLASGDLVAFRSAGAYGAVMASSYNSRLLVPEVLVDGDRFAVVRPRPNYDTLLAADRIPNWLQDANATANELAE